MHHSDPLLCQTMSAELGKTHIQLLHLVAHARHSEPAALGFLNGMNPMIIFRNCTLQQSSVQRRD